MVWSSLWMMKFAALGIFVSFSISIFLCPSGRTHSSCRAGAFIAPSLGCASPPHD